MVAKHKSKDGAGLTEAGTEQLQEVESPSVSSKESNENDIHMKSQKAAFKK
jgi:hypothetical protein